jgi:hypothetical protein
MTIEGVRHLPRSEKLRLMETLWEELLRSPRDRRQEATPHPNPLPAPSSRGEGEDRAGGARCVVHPMDCTVSRSEIEVESRVWHAEELAGTE